MLSLVAQDPAQSLASHLHLGVNVCTHRFAVLMEEAAEVENLTLEKFSDALLPASRGATDAAPLQSTTPRPSDKDLLREEPARVADSETQSSNVQEEETVGQAKGD